MAALDENSRQHNSESRITQMPSPSTSAKTVLLPASMEAKGFTVALKRLVSSKRTLELTPHQLETWLAALSIYVKKPQIVNRAIIEIATADDPFPDLGKLLTKCERIRRTLEGTLPQDVTQVKFANTAALAKAWGLEV